VNFKPELDKLSEDIILKKITVLFSLLVLKVGHLSVGNCAVFEIYVLKM
jgi:hypothetical protein